MRFKKLLVLFILFTSFTLSGCQLLNSVSDLTSSANGLILESETLLREINTKVETDTDTLCRHGAECQNKKKVQPESGCTFFLFIILF